MQTATRIAATSARHRAGAEEEFRSRQLPTASVACRAGMPPRNGFMYPRIVALEAQKSSPARRRYVPALRALSRRDKLLAREVHGR